MSELDDWWVNAIDDENYNARNKSENGDCTEGIYKLLFYFLIIIIWKSIYDFLF